MRVWAMRVPHGLRRKMPSETGRSRLSTQQDLDGYNLDHGHAREADGIADIGPFGRSQTTCRDDDGRIASRTGTDAQQIVEWNSEQMTAGEDDQDEREQNSGAAEEDLNAVGCNGLHERPARANRDRPYEHGQSEIPQDQIRNDWHSPANRTGATKPAQDQRHHERSAGHS